MRSCGTCRPTLRRPSRTSPRGSRGGTCSRIASSSSDSRAAAVWARCTGRSDRVTGEAVALKVARRGPHEERFAREARVLAELDHPAIVRYVAHGETAQGQPYLAMEWLHGQDLAQRLAVSRLTVAESLDVACRAAAGLAAAHAAGPGAPRRQAEQRAPGRRPASRARSCSISGSWGWSSRTCRSRRLR